MHEHIVLQDILEISDSTGRKKPKYTTDQLLFYQAVLLKGITGTGSEDTLIPPKCHQMADHHEQCPVLTTHDRKKHAINWKCTHCKRQGTITGLEQVAHPEMTKPAGRAGLTGRSGKTSRSERSDQTKPVDQETLQRSMDKDPDSDNPASGDPIAGTDYPPDTYPQLIPQVYLSDDEFEWLKKNLDHSEVDFNEFLEMSESEDDSICFFLPFLFCALAVGILSNKTWRKKSDQMYASEVCFEIQAAAGAWFQDMLHARSSNVLKDKDYLYYFPGVEDLEQLTGEMDQVIRAIRNYATKKGWSFVQTMDMMLGERGPWEYLVWPDEPPRVSESSGKDDRYLENFFEEAEDFFEGMEDWDAWDDVDDASPDNGDVDDDMWDDEPETV